MGGLAFAPASEDVLRFTAHLEATHLLFKGAFAGVFESESEAEARRAALPHAAALCLCGKGVMYGHELA
jgi:hypothetical protein